jgi:Flp pilus assembly pilin Flp
MSHWLNQDWCEDEGALSFEWTLLVTILTIGIVGGLAAVRDSVIDEFGDVAQAMLALDHSMTIAPPLATALHNPSDPSSASDSGFIDALHFVDCPRNDAIFNQGGPIDDVDS